MSHLLYQLGAAGYWTGATQVAAAAHTVPAGWTARPVPTLVAGQYAQLTATGWRVTDTPPPVAHAAQPQPPLPTPPRRISVGAFFDRFGQAKWAILADDNPGVRAVIQDASVRQYIDLDNPDLPAGLAIVAARHADIDISTILGRPVQEDELP